MFQSILQDVKQQIDLLTWNERLNLIAYMKKGQVIAKQKDFKIV
jgi:hypothetical protein